MSAQLTASLLASMPSLGEIGENSFSAAHATQLLFTERSVDTHTHTVTEDVFLHDADDFSVRQLTRNAPGVRCLSPQLAALDRASGDGVADHALFARDGLLWALPLAGGEAYVLFAPPRPLESFSFFVDFNNNAFLLCALRVSLSDSLSHSHTHLQTHSQTHSHSHTQRDRKREREIERESEREIQQLYESLCPDRADGLYTHLCSVPVELDGKGRYRAELTLLKDLMRGMPAHCPDRAAFAEGVRVSPDGRFLAFICKKYSTGAHPCATSEVLLGELRPHTLFGDDEEHDRPPLEWRVVSKDVLPSEQGAAHACPSFSPDSTHLAFLSHSHVTSATLTVRDLTTHRSLSTRILGDLSLHSLLWLHTHAEEGSDEATRSQTHTLAATGRHRGSDRLFVLTLSHHTTLTDSDTQSHSLTHIHTQCLCGDGSRTAVRRVGELLYFVESSLSVPPSLRRVALSECERGRGRERVFEIFSHSLDVPSQQCGSDSVREQTLTPTPMSVSEVYCPFAGCENGDVCVPQVTQLSLSFPTHADTQTVKDSDLLCWFVHPVIAPVAISSDTLTDAHAEPGLLTETHWEDGYMDGATAVLDDKSIPLIVVLRESLSTSECVLECALPNAWTDRCLLTLLASAGYAVVALPVPLVHPLPTSGDSSATPTPSAFCESVLRSVDAVSQHYSFVDGERVALLGIGSMHDADGFKGQRGYGDGGWLAHMLNGHSTGRFRCIVSDNGVFSLVNQYYGMRDASLLERTFGLPWEQRALYDEWSPHTYVSSWSVPTLVIHSNEREADGRAAFTALQRRCIPSQLLLMNPETQRTQRCVRWYETIFAWIERWVAKE